MQRKTKKIAKFDGLEPRRCDDIKGIVAPEIGPRSFGTFEKQAPGLHLIRCMLTSNERHEVSPQPSGYPHHRICREVQKGKL